MYGGSAARMSSASLEEGRPTVVAPLVPVSPLSLASASGSAPTSSTEFAQGSPLALSNSPSTSQTPLSSWRPDLGRFEPAAAEADLAWALRLAAWFARASARAVGSTGPPVASATAPAIRACSSSPYTADTTIDLGLAFGSTESARLGKAGAGAPSTALSGTVADLGMFPTWSLGTPLALASKDACLDSCFAWRAWT
ncbi:hypothetical protein M427DRAFT_138152 [Gonapodya prolifera JEL478]|uniref:Uncharacterized protein n=1 Tax=Gonapodya prolifera (strain JEL478) TaxID=1344416 RepID=A0A139A430_GONPJ|nr:hypothetical protein M427DRAFT_138152 [Gonapodya prolifera JEL478]|eukprot:KXS11562.1 hypothetical protein M427DRAFT_138152 [Gonapodya prolifera JEL478]